MKSKGRYALILLAVAGFGYLQWDAAPSVIESRMLTKTSRFLEALRANDRPAALAMTTSDAEAKDKARDPAPPAETGSFKLDSDAEVYEGVARSFWDPLLLAQLARHARSPVSYSPYAEASSPSIILNFDCSRTTTRCLEHLRVSYSARAGKIESYIAFWNDPAWREAFQVNRYAEGLVTKPCDKSCP